MGGIEGQQSGVWSAWELGQWLAVEEPLYPASSSSLGHLHERCEHTRGNYSETNESDRTRLVHWATLCMIIAAGAWLRFHDLGAGSIWLEEASARLQSKDSLGELISRTAQDIHLPPLHNLFLYASINLIGDGEWSLRLESSEGPNGETKCQFR